MGRRLDGAGGRGRHVFLRCPKSLWLRDEPAPLHLNDGESARRYALDLATMTLSDESLAVSSGEWACHGGSNHDLAVDSVLGAAALVEIVWHDCYQFAALTLQVAPGALRRQLPGRSETVTAMTST